MCARPSISAYVPIYNSRPTASDAVASIRDQTVPVDEVFVIDDGSTDGGGAESEQNGIRVVRFENNQGRGAVRAHAMETAKGDWVLCCDATNRLAPDFLETALPWLEDPRVAAVAAPLSDPNPRTIADRWRARHLFKASSSKATSTHKALTTAGLLLSREAVFKVGNFRRDLHATEDIELGNRLADSGFTILTDPNLGLYTTVSNSIAQLLERYDRWNADPGKPMTFKRYLKQIYYSIKVLGTRDLRAHDPLCLPISLWVPHYQYWKSLSQRRQQPLPIKHP